MLKIQCVSTWTNEVMRQHGWCNNNNAPALIQADWRGLQCMELTRSHIKTAFCEPRLTSMLQSPIRAFVIACISYNQLMMFKFTTSNYFVIISSWKYIQFTFWKISTNYKVKHQNQLVVCVMKFKLYDLYI